MDIENPKGPSLQIKPNAKSQIEESKQKILKLKIQIMQIICATFYPIQHRCILSYVTACTLQQQQVRDDDLAVFQNHLSLIVDLKQGYFITSYEIYEKKKQGKKDKKITCYKLDTIRFFALIAKILKDLQAKLKKINEFYEESEKPGQEGEQKKVYKRCKNCQTKQNLQLKDFGFDGCQKCQGTQFEEVIINDREKTRIAKLNEIIMIVFGKLKEIRDLDSGLQSQIEINEQKKESKVSEIDNFMNPYVKFLKERHEYIEIEANLKTIKQAEKLQAPPTQFQRVKEMIRSREERQRARQKSHNGQNKLKSS